jgi:hypothetical protein
VKQLITRVTAVVAVAMLAACAESPAGPTSSSLTAHAAGAVPANGAGRFIDQYVQNLDGERLGCRDLVTGAQDVLVLQGQLVQRYQEIIDGSGGTHVSVHVMPVGFGATGEDTGDTYRAAYTEHFVARESAMGSGGTSRWKFTFTSQQTGQAFRVELVNKWTQNANGEWVVDRGSFEGECYI